MKIIFMGTSCFALPSLEKIASINKYKILKVISTPDTLQGRGLKLVPPPVKDKAISLNLPLMQEEKINSEIFLSKIRELEPDIGIVISFGKILKKELLNLPKYGCINIHGSLLPSYRGPAPIQWAIINGEKKTGVTSIFMNEGIDTGDIILKKELDILPIDTSETLFSKLSVLAGDLLLETLSLIESGKFSRYPQDNNLASYTRLIKKEDGKINWDSTATKIVNLIRGLTPWPGTYTYIGNKMLKIYEACVSDEYKNIITPGKIIKIEKGNGITVSASEGAILIKTVQPENKKKMSAYDFALGYNIKIGQELKNEYSSKY